MPYAGGELDVPARTPAGLSDDHQTCVPAWILVSDEIPRRKSSDTPPPRRRINCVEDFGLAYRITNSLYSKKDLDEFLTEHPRFDLNSAGRCGYTVLQVAMERSTALATHVLDLEPHLVHECCLYNRPYLVHAAALESFELVRLMCDRGADVRACEGTGNTALSESAEHAENLEMTKYLLLRGGIIYDGYRRRRLREANVWGDGTPERIHRQKKHLVAAIAGIRHDYMTRGASHPCLTSVAVEMASHILAFVCPVQALRSEFLARIDVNDPIQSI